MTVPRFFQLVKELPQKEKSSDSRGECEGHLGDTVPKWGAAVNGAPGALQSRDPDLLEGRQGPASIQINSRRSLAQQGSGERSDVFLRRHGFAKNSAFYVWVLR